MQYIVYILYSSSHKKHYTGYTSNLTQRLLSHNELGYDWTSRYRPWNLIYTKEFEDKTRFYGEAVVSLKDIFTHGE